MDAISSLNVKLWQNLYIIGR